MSQPRDPTTGAMADRSLVSTFVDDIRYFAGRLGQSAPRGLARRTLADLEEFYLSDRQRARLASARWLRRTILRAWWLFKCLVQRLTPARRALLAVGLLNLTALRFSSSNPDFQYTFRVPSIGVPLILLVLALELKDKLTARDELEAGRTVQRALMPARPPAVEGWDIWFYSESANEVSGDLIDAMALDDGRTALVLADVSGKGLSAALLSAKLQATVRALVTDAPAPAALGERLNRIMYRDGVRGRFATLVQLTVAPNDGAVTVLNAGHLSPLVVRSTGTIEELPRGAVALGMVPSAEYFDQRAVVGTGDTIVVYSDGVTEAMNTDRELFGDERLLDALRASANAAAADIGRAVVDAVRHYVGAAPVHDDVSLVVARRLA